METMGNGIEEVAMKTGREEHERAAGRTARTAAALDRIAVALRGLEFGTVTAVVQNGVVVQVERTEKVRLARPQ